MQQVVNIIENDVDFNNSDDRHLFGDIYEKILKDLHVVDEDHGNPEDLLKEYLQLEKEVMNTRNKLKKELMASLGDNV